MKALNFKQCLIFREIARTKNFTKAAHNLYLTQSAVSHAIKDLENEAETQLFERLHRSVKLTPAGELFLKEIQPMIEEFETVEARLPHLEKQSPLKIASCITFAQTQLPQRLQRFQVLQPAASFEVQVFPAAESLARLEEGKVDLAFIEGQIFQQSVEAKKIAEYPLCVVAEAAHPMAELSFGELLEQPLLLRERGSAVRETFESSAVLQGEKVFPIWESVDSQALIAAVKAGLGISVLPKILVEEELLSGRLKEIKIKEWSLTNDITALLRKSRYQSHLLGAFWQLLDEI
ncbi:LysR family transcriptional regulator [Enterococcus viikkiensis]|uniref:LysR family transcriptional regulator n=1 Tax=Enterococcus viikkiensis TaxID=930854 RepID=UPI001FE485F9|nr:LysR family transcriptional regulator [Enterococcus viikkiensis]